MLGSFFFTELSEYIIHHLWKTLTPTALCPSVSQLAPRSRLPCSCCHLSKDRIFSTSFSALSVRHNSNFINAQESKRRRQLAAFFLRCSDTDSVLVVGWERWAERENNHFPGRRCMYVHMCLAYPQLEKVKSKRDKLVHTLVLAFFMVTHHQTLAMGFFILTSKPTWVTHLFYWKKIVGNMSYLCALKCYKMLYLFKSFNWSTRTSMRQLKSQLFWLSPMHNHIDTEQWTQIAA